MASDNDGGDVAGRGRKRAAAPKQENDEEDDVVRRSDLDDILKGFAADQQASTMQNFQKCLTGYDKRVQARFDECEAKIADVRDRQKNLEAEQKRVSDMVLRLAGQLEAAEQVAKDASEGLQYDPSFDRAIDAKILRISANILVTKLQIEGRVRQWVGELNVSEEGYEILGPRDPSMPAKHWTVRFTGMDRTAIIRARNAIADLRKPDGSWKQFNIEMQDGQTARLFISEDKNPKQVTTEIHSKILGQRLESLFPGDRFVVRRREGVVYHQQVPLIRVVAAGKKTSHLEFDMDSLIKFGMQERKEAIRDSFLEAVNFTGGTASASSAKWST